MKPLRDYWNEARGNFVGGLLVVAVVGIGGQLGGAWVWLWKSFVSLALATQVMGSLLLLESIALVVVTRLWRHARRKTVVFHINGKEAIPEFILPRQQPAPLSAPMKATSNTPTKPAHPIVLRFQEGGTPNPGVVGWIENLSLNPVEDCKVIVQSFGSYHPEQGGFRNPSFTPSMLINTVKLEPEGPDKLSPRQWVIRPVSASHMSVEIPAGNKNKLEVKEPAVWKAVFRVLYGQSEYEESACFSWSLGSPAKIEDSAKYGF